MLKKIIFSLCIFLTHFFAQAQTDVSGELKDTTSKSNLQFAVITLLKASDSILISFTRADAGGKFTLKNIKPDKYILWVMHPAMGDYVEEIEVSSSTQSLPVIALTPKSKLLEAVIVKSGGAMK